MLFEMRHDDDLNIRNSKSFFILVSTFVHFIYFEVFGFYCSNFKNYCGCKRIDNRKMLVSFDKPMEKGDNLPLFWIPLKYEECRNYDK